MCEPLRTRITLTPRTLTGLSGHAVISAAVGGLAVWAIATSDPTDVLFAAGATLTVLAVVHLLVAAAVRATTPTTRTSRTRRPPLAAPATHRRPVPVHLTVLHPDPRLAPAAAPRGPLMLPAPPRAQLARGHHPALPGRRACTDVPEVWHRLIRSDRTLTPAQKIDTPAAPAQAPRARPVRSVGPARPLRTPAKAPRARPTRSVEPTRRLRLVTAAEPAQPVESVSRVRPGAPAASRRRPTTGPTRPGPR